MEDVSVTEGLLAVLDGHGGRECSDFIAPQLGVLATLPQEDWIECFINLDDAFRARGQPSGSTCVAALLRGDILEVANLGDSRAVLYRGNATIAHTVDHKPDAPTEKERIVRCGGTVQTSGEGPARIAGVAVSRAFGTFVSPMSRHLLKDPSKPHTDRLVSCIPELFAWPVEPGDVVVLACDGVWDVLNEDDIRSIVSGQYASETSPWDIAQSARMICERALQTSTDNVSCIVAELGAPVPHIEVQSKPNDSASAEFVSANPSFNQASRDEQLDIGRILEYGETLIEFMTGLETDLIVDGLWLGQVGDSCFPPFLAHAGITRVVNCAAEVERPTMDGIEVFSLKWRDSEDQGKAETKGNFRRLRQATLFIHESMQSGATVLVHCVQGISRSASVVVAYLMEYKGMAIEDAVSLVRDRHQGALKPFRLQEMLRAFHYALKSEPQC